MQPGLVRSASPGTLGNGNYHPKRQFNRRWLIIGILIALVVIGSAIAAFLLRAPTAQTNNQDRDVKNRFTPLNVSLGDLAKSGSLFIDGVPSLSVNGQLKVNNSLVLRPMGIPAGAIEGQMYYDQSLNQVRYYDGSKFSSLISAQDSIRSIGGFTGGALQLGNNLQINGDRLQVSGITPGVASVQGQGGDISFTSGGGIAIDGTTLTNTGVLSVGGVTGEVGVGSGLEIVDGTLSNSGVVGVSSTSNNLVVSDDGNGNITLSTIGSGTVDSPGGTAGRIAKFTGAQTIEDSLLSESGTTITVNGDLAVTGSLSLGTLLSVPSGGTGVASLANNGVLVGQGTSPVTAVTAAGSGLCLMSTAGSPSFQACPGGGGGVNSLNTLSGDLTLANSSAAGTTITIDDASTTQKGIASFNSANFTVTSGAVNTIQNISTSATPTFAGINTNSITPSGALTVGSTSQSLTLQGSNTTVTRTNGANTASLTFVAPTANVTYRLQTAAAGTYDVCTTAGNCVGVGGGVTTPGGTLNSLARFTGSQTLGDSIISDNGSLVTVAGNLTVTGTTTLSTPLAITSGGTGANSATTARSNLGAAKSGANTDITSLGGLTTALSIVQGGTGATSLTANGVLLGNGTSPISSLAAGGAGQCLVSTVGAPIWTTCPGSGGVTSINSQTGVVTIANASAAAGTITLDDASTSQKGIASFNSTNFSVTSGAVNTIQNINTAATPTFAGINTNTITPSGALTVGATTQSLTLQGSNTTITRTNGANLASLTFVAPTANVIYRLQTAAAGTYDVCTTAGNCTGVGGGVTTPGGTTNSLARFTGSQTLGDSIISDDGSLVTVAGNLTVTGTTTLSTPLAVTSGGTGAADAITARSNLSAAKSGANSDITSLSGLTTALSVVQGGTGAASLTANGVLLGNGTSAISSLAAGGAGQCLVSTVGAPIWTTCPGSGGVTSINSQTGVVTIANASASAGTITLDNATTAQKGIASFNSTNFTVTSGAVNTTQDINVTAAPTFGRLTLSSSQASNAMLLVNNTNAGASGNLIDLQLNGASRLAVTPAGNMTLTGTLNGQTISSAASFSGTLAVAGAANLNGGANVTGTLAANTITPSAALTVGATNQSFTLQGNASSTLTATSGANTTTVAFQTPTANVSYRLLTAAAGTYDICTTVGNCAGVGGGVTTAGGTTNALAKFTGGQAIGDSIITDDGSTVTVGGTLAVNTITPSGAMTIGATGQNLTLQGATTTLKANAGGFTNTLAFATPSGSNKTITLPNATGTVAVSATGPLAVDASGNITCATCVTSGGGSGGQSAVDSIDGQSGTVLVANATGSGGTITIDDASTSQKGIAQFNSTNFSVVSGVVNTVQDINTTAAPTFGHLILTSSQASNDMLAINNTNVSASGSLLKLQLNGSNRFTVDPAGNVVANGTITSGAVNGQTISSAASFTGTVAVTGLASLNGGAAVTGTLTANTITPTASMTVGSTAQTLTLQGSGSTTLSATDSGNKTTVAFQTPTANVTYRFLTAAAGTYDVCTSVGNCASGIGGSGTTGKIAKFTASGTIGDSLLSETGSTVTAAGNLNITSGNQFQINGTQISSTALSNDANLAKLNGAQTFTGTSNVFKNSADSLVAFQIQPSGSATPVFNADTTNSRIGIGTATPGYKLDVVGDANLSTGSAYKINGVDICTASGCTIAAGSANYIQNQSALDQTADFRISGVARANTSVQTPLLDTATAVALDIGTTNATAINLNKATNITGALTQSGGTFSLTGNNNSTISTSTNALTLTSASTAVWSTTSGSLTLQAATSSNNIVINGASNTMSFNTGTSGPNPGVITIGSANTPTVNVGGTTNNIRTVNVGTGTGGSQAQTVNVGSAGGTSTTLIQGGSGSSAIALTPGSGGSISATTSGAGNINLTSAASITAKATTAFAVQNGSSIAQLTVDTANARVYVGPTAGDTVGTLTVLGNKTNAGDPTGINGAMYYNSSTHSFRCYVNGAWYSCLGGMRYSQTNQGNQSGDLPPAGDTVGNTTTATTFTDKYTVPANDCTAGRVYRMTAGGVISYPAAGDAITVSILWGATTIGVSGSNDSLVAGGSANTNVPWFLEGTVTCYTKFAGGTAAEFQGTMTFSNNANGPAQTIALGNNAIGQTITTASTQDLALRWKWTTASTTRTITLRTLVIEALGP